MTRVLITTGAAIAAAVALAGCGGGGGGATVGMTATTPSTTTGGVAGVQTTQNSATFKAQVNGFQQKLSAALKQLQKGNVAGAANVGGPLLMNCQKTVDRLGKKANTTAQQTAVSHLHTACQDMSNASQKAASGDMNSAKALAQQALAEVKQATAQLH